MLLLDSVAPEHLAEGWDQVGLHVGGPGWAVDRALLCIDLTDAVVSEAAELGCGLIVAYHPPIFAPLKRLTETDWTQRRVLKAAEHGIAVYSPHTALDAVRGGMNDWLAESLGEGWSAPIEAKRFGRDAFKLVTYVPKDHAEAVRQAMAEGGAGQIGNYRECAFTWEGQGCYRPIEGANPAIGEVGKLERVAELRIEMLCEGHVLGEAVAALRSAHPYEEPAIDVLPMSAEPEVDARANGAGRVRYLDQPVSSQALMEQVKARLGLSQVKVGGLETKVEIEDIAVCVGSGGKLFEGVDADAYVTGEMQHHQVLDLVQQGKVVVLAGHTNTERPFLPVYRDKLTLAAPGVAWRVSEADRVPLGLA